MTTKKLKCTAYTANHKITFAAGCGVMIEPNKTLLCDYAGSKVQEVLPDSPFIGGCDWAALPMRAVDMLDDVCGIPISVAEWNFVARAAGKRDVRYYLNGVLLDTKAGAIVATDGHRMHKLRADLSVIAEYVQSVVPDLIVPSHVAQWITKSAKKSDRLRIAALPEDCYYDLAISCGDRLYLFNPMSSAHFPDWQRAERLHSESDTHLSCLSVRAEDLRAAAKGLALSRYSKGKAIPCLFVKTFEGQTVPSVLIRYLPEGKADYAFYHIGNTGVEYYGAPKDHPKEWAANLFYILDALQGLNGQANLKYSTNGAFSFQLYDATGLATVMQTRV